MTTNRTKLFYDSEFTGLTAHGQLISMGFVSEDGQKTFYAEFTDFGDTVDPWIAEHVIAHCQWIPKDVCPFVSLQGANAEVYGDRLTVANALTQWLAAFEAIEIWADCNPYDWVFFCELFGGAFGTPKNVHYMPGEISTVFRLKGLDPDTDRMTYAGITTASPSSQPVRHHALNDAQASRACFLKLMDLPDPSESSHAPCSTNCF